MKRPAIFFDRDNTLIVSDGYLGDPEKVELMEGAAESVARARLLGFATVVISNQSGVARGMFDEEAVNAVNRKIDQMLLATNRSAVIDRHEFCPYHPEGTVEQYKKESDLRKPKPGMILLAAQHLALDLDRSWVIGDAPRDIEAGKAAGCRTILFKPNGVEPSPAAQEALPNPPEYEAPTLRHAMDFVEANRQRPVESVEPSASTSATPTGAPSEEPDTAPAATAAAPSTASAPPTVNTARLEQLAEQILDQLRKRSEREHYPDFSVSKLLAGIVQIITLALLFLSYLNRNDSFFLQYILFATFFEVLTIALLVMGRDK